VVYVTEDGSMGEQGLATDYLPELLQPDRATYACGPHGFTEKFIEQASAAGVGDCQISMESQMACGVGACLGCVINTREGYQRVCVEGPIFDLSTLQT
jgi:NAD(P)H-flavin reductase